MLSAPCNAFFLLTHPSNTRKLLSFWVNSPHLRGAPKFNYSRGIYKAFCFAGIDEFDWFDLAQNRSFRSEKVNNIC